MDDDDVVTALSALAQGSRLKVFRLLVTAGPAGMAAGAIARELGITANTLSFHLSHLKGAGLVAVRRAGRSLVYAADYARMNAVLDHLTRECCSRDSCRKEDQ